MRKILYIILLLIPVYAFSQEKVVFYLQADGTFKTDDEKDFVVVHFDSLSSSQLYTMIKSNINKVYKNPSKVISEVEGTSISIRGFSETITTDKMPLCAQSVYSGYYNLLFQFKDGRIRVDAPKIDEYVYEGLDGRKFEFIASDFFKKGKVNPKKEKYKIATESQLNIIINKILGLLDSTNEEEW